MRLLYPPGDFLQGGGVRGLETCAFIVLFILAGLKLPSLWRLDRRPWPCPWPLCAGHLTLLFRCPLTSGQCTPTPVATPFVLEALQLRLASAFGKLREP